MFQRTSPGEKNEENMDKMNPQTLMMLQKIKVTQQRKLHKYCILDDGMVLDPIISNSIKSAPANPINLFSTAEYTLVASAC